MNLEKLYKNGHDNQNDCDKFLDHYYFMMESKIKSTYPNADEDETEEKMLIIAEILNNLYKDNSNVSFTTFDLMCNNVLNEILKTFNPNYSKEELTYDDDEIGIAVQSSLRYYLSQMDDSRLL